MIVDIEQWGDKRMFVTEQVSSIRKNANGQWAVTFVSSPRLFNYNPARLLYLTDPEIIELGEKGLYIDNKHIHDVAQLQRFTHGAYVFFRVTYSNGYYENLEGSRVYVTRTPIDQNGGSTWDYLRKLAAETGLTTADEQNILSKQYDLVDVMRDNVPLAQYLGDKTQLNTFRLPKCVYYPFGCNASQKEAVEKALTHQVSIIQGPPGTGKTQTLLNIIANLLVARKTVLVVSNNNCAVENVAEKLQKEGLNFLVASLGSLENKKEFIAQQSDYPDMSTWHIASPATTLQQLKESLKNVSIGFDGQLRQAKLKAEYDALLKETRYNEMWAEDRALRRWLEGKSSFKLMKLFNAYQLMMEKSQKPPLWFRLKWSFLLGLKMYGYLAAPTADLLQTLGRAYYVARKREIEEELEQIKDQLEAVFLEKSTQDLRSSSLLLLKHTMAQRCQGKSRKIFSLQDLKPRTKEFLEEYPIVLSTTYSAKSCISKDWVFDYVIMDEASQVDIKTGALALSCAMNAVIIGDDKQLPNVVSREEAGALNALQTHYEVDDRYNAVTHSFLQSCTQVFETAPTTLLREHYRCHPKIIEFCNQHFYQGELIAMTEDKNEENVLQIVRTVKGNHARGHYNQREIDVLTQEVLCEYGEDENVGIITPYSLQAEEINKTLGMQLASTVHKYQGRECDTIVMSIVDNVPTSFSDDAHLLNVAISRAKRHLCMVINGNDLPKDSNLAQLIAYMQYNNFEVKQSKLHSVFDLLYKSYTAERLAYEAAHPSVSDYLSENLLYELLLKAIDQLHRSHTSVLCHYPLSRLISDMTILTDEQRTFVESPFSHVDFLVYNSLTKQPLQTIEVDGWKFHQGSHVQQQRDKLKDEILTKYGLCPYRISTTDTVDLEMMKKIINDGDRA